MKGNLAIKQLDKWIAARAPIAGKSDGGGLTFTLSDAGTASWVFRYRHPGKQREMTNVPPQVLVRSSFVDLRLVPEFLGH